MKNDIYTAEDYINHIVEWLRRYFVDNGNENTKAVIGISGGKDSTVAAALLVKAIGAERVVGVAMPCGVQYDFDDSIRVMDSIGIPVENRYIINIREQVDAFYTQYKSVFGENPPSYITTNVPARVRMTNLYMLAAKLGGRVVNTSNASEIYVGYSTKFGDLAGDLAPLKRFYVRDIVAMGKALGLPTDLVEKKPADGMTFLTDEENLGFTYATLDSFLIDDVQPDYITLRRINNRHNQAHHKMDIIYAIPGPMRHSKSSYEEF